MRLNYVLDRFALISSLEGEELSKWAPLCKDAMEELMPYAENFSLSDETKVRRLSNLAGVLAYYKYCLYTAGNVKSLTIGALSISEGDTQIEHAKNLFETEKAAVSDLLKNTEEFSFQRVVI